MRVAPVPVAAAHEQRIAEVIEMAEQDEQVGGCSREDREGDNVAVAE
jgi:hypothetical protein